MGFPAVLPDCYLGASACATTVLRALKWVNVYSELNTVALLRAYLESINLLLCRTRAELAWPYVWLEQHPSYLYQFTFS